MRLLTALVALSSSFAGCVADDPVEPAVAPPEPDDPDDMPVDDVPESFAPLAFEGVLAVSFGTPVVAGNPASDEGDFLFEFVVPANATEAVVTMSWNATQSTSAALRLLVETTDEAGTLLGSGDGVSPLVVTVDVTEIQEATLRTRTFASANGGVAKDQPFALVVSFL